MTASVQSQSPGPEVSKTQEKEPLSIARLCTQLSLVYTFGDAGD